VPGNTNIPAINTIKNRKNPVFLEIFSRFLAGDDIACNM
jgi:hypothetical protein